MRDKTPGGAQPEGWHEQLRRGGLELAVMLAVSNGPKYGLEIIHHLDSQRDLALPEGTVYPLLSRLAREGDLKAEWRQTEPHPRKYYQLTAQGRRRLAVMCHDWRAFSQKIELLMSEAGIQP
ncbi:MAG TPA: PadR family transcriptional regulator [Vicinamibacterales bacterium]|nr:PadR family transcriptional regulator [Vicinamibacterales bacterium]